MSDKTPNTFSVTANRKHKDRLFRLIFGQKEALLHLYNALAGTDYENPEELTITTKEDVFYLQMKNDVSFILDDYLNLYEHQSTMNPNMPLRGLFYIADLYKNLIGPLTRLHQRSLVKIPNLRYIVFYNGKEQMPDQSVLRLSDAFLHSEETPDLEITAHMININYGHNQKLLDSCLELKGYSILINKIRLYQEDGGSLEEAIKQAIDDCLNSGFLTEFLGKERQSVMGSILAEFDEELYKQIVHDEGFEDGRQAGLAAGLETGIQAFILDYLEENFPVEKILNKLCTRFQLSPEQAENYFKKYAEK